MNQVDDCMRWTVYLIHLQAYYYLSTKTSITLSIECLQHDGLMLYPVRAAVRAAAVQATDSDLLHV